MNVKPKISPEFIQEKYIELLENANILSYKKTNSFSLKNISYIMGVMSIGVLLFILAQYVITYTTDVFENQLTAVVYNEQDILIETQEGVFYQIDENTNQKWLTSSNLLLSVSGKKIHFNATSTIPEKCKTTYTLWIPKDKKYQLELIDGTKIYINSNTHLEFANTRVAHTTNAILKGEAFFEVAHNPKSPFSIRATDMEIEVYGTAFNVSNYTNNNYTSVALLEGSVRVSGLQNEKTFIQPGQQAVLHNTDKKLIINQAQFSETLVWRADQIHFNNETLLSITNKLAKWYDVSFVISSLDLQNTHFTGSFSKEDGITHFLQMLDYTEGVQYKIDNKKVTLYR